jgi:hypothetical protein
MMQLTRRIQIIENANKEGAKNQGREWISQREAILNDHQSFFESLS